MGNGSIIIGISIAIVSIFIYCIKNKEIFAYIKDLLRKINNIKIKKAIFIILILFSTILSGKFIVDNVKDIIDNIELYKITKENNKIFEYGDKKIAEEAIFYKEVTKKEYINQKYYEPYIPTGFEYVEGDFKIGYVIQDENKNQYVWVPCTNKEIEGIVKIEKRNFVDKAFISKDSCYNEEYKEFLKSALENGGFYISRFEIGKENNKPVSKKNIEVWQNVTRTEAIEIVKDMYSENVINCELINAYAYDSTLEWIKSNNKIEKNVWDFEKNKVIYSGRNEYNKIYDFIDNVMELTLETSYNTVIIRGFSAGDSELDYGVKFSDESRYSIFEENYNFNVKDPLAFRTVLYK